MSLRQLRSFPTAYASTNRALGFSRRSGPVQAYGWIVALSPLLLTAPIQAQAPAYSVTIRDHRFTPKQIEVPANQKVELHVINADPTPSEFESIDLRREKVVTGGQEITVYIGPLRPGSYEFFDDFNPRTRAQVVAR